MADAIIRAEGLTKNYAGGVGGDVLAVDDIELEIYSGEIYGLLGPNGAGKSTTIGMLTTRVIPTGGSITISGVDVVAKPALAKQLIAPAHNRYHRQRRERLAHSVTVNWIVHHARVHLIS